MESIYKEYSNIFKALSDETRLKIIDMLSCGELCACKILEEFHITQPTLSYHMKILTECGLVNGVKDGSWMRYSLNEDKSKKTVNFIRDITNDKTECICRR